MRKDPLSEQIGITIMRITERLMLADVISINPDVIAAETYKEFDPGAHAPMEIKYASILQFRAMAGKSCAKQYDPVARAAEMHAEQLNLFSKELQSHYPVKTPAGVRYVLRSQLTPGQRAEISHRMRSAGEALIHHI